MRRSDRTPSLTMRLLTSLVGMLFMFSMVAGQLPYCQCGIFCLYDEGTVLVSDATTPAMEDHGCCASEGQNDSATAITSQENVSCCDGDACECPVEISSQPDLPPAPLQFVLPAFDIHAESMVTTAFTPSISVPMGIENAPRWRPTRGSPIPHPSLHTLHSVYLI